MVERKLASLSKSRLTTFSKNSMIWSKQEEALCLLDQLVVVKQRESELLLEISFLVGELALLAPPRNGYKLESQVLQFYHTHGKRLITFVMQWQKSLKHILSQSTNS